MVVFYNYLQKKQDNKCSSSLPLHSSVSLPSLVSPRQPSSTKVTQHPSRLRPRQSSKPLKPLIIESTWWRTMEKMLTSTLENGPRTPGQVLINFSTEEHEGRWSIDYIMKHSELLLALMLFLCNNNFYKYFYCFIFSDINPNSH